jgi:nucleotide-binding universal stress UspA family protein
MNILLAIDSSVSSQVVVDEVVARPWPEDTRMCVLSVVEAARILSIPALIQTATEAAQSITRNAADRLASHGIEASTSVIQGNVRKDIVEYAQEWGADFIIVGSHGHGTIERFFLGSVAKSVLRHAHCSVEIVRAAASRVRKSNEGMRILLATDGSDYSTAAARSIAARPWPDASEVRIISVAEIVVPAIEPWYIDVEIMDALREDRVNDAREAVAAAEKVISGTGLDTSRITPEGMVRTRILDEVDEWGADLLVVGAHGRHAVERLLIGSVSEAVAIHAPCSVEVIRERARPAES